MQDLRECISAHIESMGQMIIRSQITEEMVISSLMRDVAYPVPFEIAGAKFKRRGCQGPCGCTGACNESVPFTQLDQMKYEFATHFESTITPIIRELLNGEAEHPRQD